MNKLNRYLIISCIIFLFFVININTTKAATTTIDSIQDLYNVRDGLSGNYELVADLNFIDGLSYDATIPEGYESVESFMNDIASADGWLPIGNSSTKFTGNFDGGEYTISNLFINKPAAEYIGLFGYTDTGSNLMNVSLAGVSVTGLGYTGGLVGYTKGSIENSYIEGGDVTISNNSDVGGLVGYNDGGTISNSYSTANVSGTYDVGGLVGTNSGTITNSYATGDVNTGITTIDNVGGLIGYNLGNIYNSYATGRVSGDDYIGGLIGGSDSGEISNSFATGNVTGSNQAAGGLLGYIMDSTLIHSYSIGTVSGVHDIGGLIGLDWGGATITNSYYNINTSGQSDTGKGESRTLEEMTYPYDETSTTTYVGWDFDTIWYHDTTGLVNNGYPYNYYIPDTTAPVISGLSNDTTPTKSKTWSWDSDDESATYRYTVNQDSSYTFEDQEYGDTKTATQSSGDGTYYLHVQAKDTSDNTSTSTVSAILDNTAPTIAILGSNPVYTFINESYTDSGATASDAVDGDITSSIVVTNTVDTNTVGTYYVTYVVSDTAGNTSTSTRTVNVINLPPASIPTYILESMNNQNQNNQEQEGNNNNNQTSGDSYFTNGSFIKTNNISTVYFISKDNTRHSYPSEAIWYSYFGKDFSFVDNKEDIDFSMYKLGKNVLFKKGTLFKIPSVPKVYLVDDDNGLIRWIKTEAKAIELYGDNWNKLVYDLDESLFSDYTEGGVIE